MSLSTQVPLGLTTRLREPNALAVRLGVDTWNIITAKLTSTVSYMIALSHKRVPTPYFWCNFLYRVKVYSNESPPWSELCVAFEKHSLKHYASGGGTEIRLGGGGGGAGVIGCKAADCLHKASACKGQKLGD